MAQPHHHRDSNPEGFSLRKDRYQEQVSQRLDSVPHRAVSSLSELFQELCCKDFGYTLLGSKPISTYSSYRDTLRGGNKLYQSANTLHCVEDVVFLHGGAFHIELDRRPELTSILFIHRPLCLEVVSKHRVDFTETLGKDLSDHELLESAIFRLWRGSLPHFLTGLLHGYGHENSLLYNRRMILTAEDQIQNEDDDQLVYHRVARTDIKPHEGFSSTQEELDSICERLKVFRPEGWQDSRIVPQARLVTPEPSKPLVNLPSFLGDPNLTETAVIAARFIEDQRRLSELVQAPDILAKIITIDCQQYARYSA